METNPCTTGDNLSILRGFIPDASVDLIYLDPVFVPPAQDGLIP